MIIEAKQVEIYETGDGKIPYEQWFDSLRDSMTRDRIKARIARLRLGSLGECKPVGEGVTELILNFGPGYRIYIGQVGTTIVVLLCGGDKSTQEADIKAAQRYWADFKAILGKEKPHYGAAN
ncbi:hypothetical protein BH18ACI2_BH18ACI2_06150 [soil metagenome]